MASLHIDRQSASHLPGETGGRSVHRAGGRQEADRRNVLMVVHGAWIQSSRTEPCRTGTDRPDESCDVRWVDTRTGHRVGQTIIEDCATAHAEDFLCRLRLGGRGSGAEDGCAVLVCTRQEEQE